MNNLLITRILPRAKKVSESELSHLDLIYLRGFFSWHLQGCMLDEQAVLREIERYPCVQLLIFRELSSEHKAYATHCKLILHGYISRDFSRIAIPGALLLVSILLCRDCAPLSLLNARVCVKE